MLNLDHKKLDVWNIGIELVTDIYEITKQFPKIEQFGLSNQLRRAAVSIPSNIAEGSSRYSHKERIRYFEIARSSLSEIDTQLEIAIKLEYIKEVELDIIDKRMNHLFAKLTNLIKKTR